MGIILGTGHQLWGGGLQNGIGAMLSFTPAKREAGGNSFSRAEGGGAQQVSDPRFSHFVAHSLHGRQETYTPMAFGKMWTTLGERCMQQASS